MRSSVGRLVALASLFLAACSSGDDAPAPSNAPDGGVSDSDVPDGDVPDSDASDGGVPDGEIPDTDVHVTFVDRYGFVTGEVEELARTTNDVVSASAIVTIDGVPKTIAGTKRADGSFVIPDVPKAPYVLELRRNLLVASESDPPLVNRYPIDGARKVRLGSDYWPRRDATRLEDATKLGLDLTVPEGIVDADVFSWIGVRSYFYRQATYYAPGSEPYDGHANLPADGATSTAGWTIEARVLEAPYGLEASGLPQAGDDLRLLQERTTRVTRDGAPFDPWRVFTRQETIGVLDAGAVDFANATTNTISGTLAAPVREPLAIEFQGSTFASLRETAGYPKNARASASISMVQEAGAGPGLYVSIAPTSWRLLASSKSKPVFDECFPGGTTCDPVACPVDCGAAIDGYQDSG